MSDTLYVLAAAYDDVEAIKGAALGAFAAHASKGMRREDLTRAGRTARATTTLSASQLAAEMR